LRIQQRRHRQQHAARLFMGKPLRPQRRVGPERLVASRPVSRVRAAADRRRCRQQPAALVAVLYRALGRGGICWEPRGVEGWGAGMKNYGALRPPAFFLFRGAKVDNFREL
jgi:hypothetical protein